jgi:ABC-2 type transport system permease protein
VSRAWAVAIKEMRQIWRDRRTVFVLVLLPGFFLFLYGYALNFDIRHVALGVQDRDGTPESRQVVASMVRSTYFDRVATIVSEADVTAQLDRDTVRAVLVIPEGFAQAIRGGQVAGVQLVINGDNANTATTVLGYANAVLRQASVSMAARGASAEAVFIGVEPRVWYNPELRSTLFLVPGLIAYISMITAVVSTALSIVREKENGTMEQVRMAPISTPSFIVGKTLPYLLLAQLSAMLVIAAAMVFFDLPMNGNWASLFVVVAVFLVGALGTGILVSTIADTQQVAFQAGALVAFLPTFILSGFIFPIASMPIVLQYITTIVPARYFLVALRGIVLKGLPLDALWQPIGALVIYAIFALGLSSLRLARR